MSTRPTTELSATNRAFLTLICALVWLIVAPAFFVVGLCKGLRSQGESECQGADWSDEFRPGPDVLSIHNDNAGAA